MQDWFLYQLERAQVPPIDSSTKILQQRLDIPLHIEAFMQVQLLRIGVGHLVQLLNAGFFNGDAKAFAVESAKKAVGA